MQLRKSVAPKSWCAQRRIYPKAKVLEEVASAGFKILTQIVDTQEGADVWMPRMVLGQSLTSSHY